MCGHTKNLYEQRRERERLHEREVSPQAARSVTGGTASRKMIIRRRVSNRLGITMKQKPMSVAKLINMYDYK